MDRGSSEAPAGGIWSTMNRWKKFLLLLVAPVLWMFGLILAGGRGYESQYFWASGCIVAIGFAVAPIWRRRASVWYWPTVALLIAINLAAMYVTRDYVAHRDLPSKGVVQGLLLLDVMGCWALMVGVAYLTDHKFPWSD